MSWGRGSARRLAVAVALAAALAGCASYRPLPLPAEPNLAARGAPGVDGRPMTIGEVVAETLRRDPDLVAARLQRGVAQAQLLQAQLLPDPTLTGSILPLLAGPGTTFAWNATLSADVRALVTLRARRVGARAASAQVDAQLLWQEWQAAGQARLLAVQILAGARLLALQRQAYDLFAARTARLQHAVAEGDLTLAAAAPDLAALQSARAQIDAGERQALVRRHQLNALLGREPDAPLALIGPPDADIDVAAAAAAAAAGALDARAADIARRRPDLIALRLGYSAQEARTRLAVLQQFPALTLGPGGGSDNSNVRSAGPQFNLTLPVFDRGRGDIALQRATRAQLRAEYAARLDAAYGQVRAGVSELAASRAQLAAARRDLPAAAAAARAAAAVFKTGALDELGYVDLLAAQLSKAQEIVTLEGSVMEEEVALATLSGAGLPRVDALSDPAV